MPQDQPDLLSPLTLGPKTAPSRIIFASHRTNFATQNTFNDRHITYYEARARGGTGIIVLEGSAIHPSDWPYEYVIKGYEDYINHGYQRVGDAIHPYGTLVLAHLNHAGGQGSSHYSQREIWAPSPVQEVNSREIPKEMEEEEIQAIKAGFVSCAQTAINAGLDGVEINAGQRSLLRQFLSPMTNHRHDEYGGELENRLRIVREIISGVYQAIGEKAIVGLRLSCDEYAPWAGIKPEDALEIARILTKNGELHFVSVTSGGIYSTHLTQAGLFRLPGYAVHLAMAIKAGIDIPVFAQGSIVDPQMALDLVKSKGINAVEMTRALIADPNLPAKMKSGPVEDIRPCILCNQGCQVELLQNPPLSCAVNPAAGYELAMAFEHVKVPRDSRKIVVLGGGPAGMEAARSAAMDGHHVELYERTARLGGSFHLAAMAPDRERLSLIVKWLENQIRKLDIKIEMGVEMDQNAILARSPDLVIVATGGHARSNPIFSKVAFPVISSRQVFDSSLLRSPGRALLIDRRGDTVTMAVSDWMIARGWQVVIVTEDLFSGQELTLSQQLIPWYERSYAAGVQFITRLEVNASNGNNLVGTGIFDRQEIQLPEIDLVVDISPELPDDELYFGLKEKGLNIVRVGDCIAPRNLNQAILEGHRAGRGVE